MRIRRAYLGDPLPEASEVEFLVVLGGPMSTADVALHPWITAECELIRGALSARRPVLGVCLGAQLLAIALGASVIRSPEVEVGWHPIKRVGGASASPLAALADPLWALSWHGDMFGLPRGGELLAKSAGCPHQAFRCGTGLGLQFHLEVLPKEIEQFAEANRGGDRGRFVQRTEEIIATPHAETANGSLRSLLDAWLASLASAEERRQSA